MKNHKVSVAAVRGSGVDRPKPSGLKPPTFSPLLEVPEPDWALGGGPRPRPLRQWQSSGSEAAVTPKAPVLTVLVAMARCQLGASWAYGPDPSWVPACDRGFILVCQLSSKSKGPKSTRPKSGAFLRHKEPRSITSAHSVHVVTEACGLAGRGHRCTLLDRWKARQSHNAGTGHLVAAVFANSARARGDRKIRQQPRRPDRP